MKHGPWILTALFVVTGMVAGCGQSGGSAQSGSSEPKVKKPDAVIGLSVLTLTNPFFRDLADAVKAEGRKHNYEVIVTSGENNVASQKDQVNDFVVKKVDAIVLCPCDSKAIGTSIQKANEAGIPVFTADIACLADGAKVVSHIATDNLGGGHEAAKAVMELFPGGGKVAILDYPEVESVIMRTKGFREELAKHPDGGIEIVATLPGGGDKEKSLKTTEDILQAHPKLDGIFAINDPSALGAVAAIEKAGRAGQIKVVGFDAQPEARQAVKDGKLYATIVQYPEKIGQKALETVVRYMAGEEVPREVLIPCTIYRKSDAEKDPSLKK